MVENHKLNPNISLSSFPFSLIKKFGDSQFSLHNQIYLTRNILMIDMYAEIMFICLLRVVVKLFKSSGKQA